MSDVKNAIKARVSVVQYRNKEAGTKEMIEEALALKKICKSGGALFLVNDRVDVAIAVGADGVHLGADDMPYRTARKMLGRRACIGMTAHNVKEAKDAQRFGADYVGASPIFYTDTKPDAGVQAGVGLIKVMRKFIAIPVIAIGGITLDNAPEIIAAGADGLCAISAVLTSPDVRAEIEKFQGLFTNFS